MKSELSFDLQTTRNATHLLLKTPGIYFLYSDDWRLLYIGKSTNVKMRVRKHLKSFVYKGDLSYSKTFFYIGVIEYPIEQLESIEVELINKHKPLLNIKDTSYVNEEISLKFNNYDKSSIKKCEYIYLSNESCNLNSLNDGYCYLHSQNKPYLPWIVKGKFVTSELCRLLYEEQHHIVQKGMYFYMSKKTFIKFVEENKELDIDIEDSKDYMRFRKHKIIIDDQHEIRLMQYPKP